ncbi:hypothetical protein [Enterocloster sp.]
MAGMNFQTGSRARLKKQAIVPYQYDSLQSSFYPLPDALKSPFQICQ